MQQEQGVKEDSKDLVHNLYKAMQSAQQVIKELVEVHKQFGSEYNRDKAYIEDINFERLKQQKK